MPNSLVEKSSFRNLIQVMDPRYPVPGMRKLSTEINKLFMMMKVAIKGHLTSATAVHFTTDIWSKKGLSSSYLGVTAHFYSHSDDQYHSVLVAVRYISELRHTAETVAAIFTEVLSEWEIPVEKVGFVVTDNGSNVVKAFRQDYFQQLVDNRHHKDEDDNDKDEDDQADESAEEMVDDDDIDKLIDEDVAEFDSCDEQHDTQFQIVGMGKRLSCYSHTLQLVVTTFTKDPYIKSLLREVYKLVKKVNSSAVATGKLLRLCSKKLVSHCPTRWSSTFLVIKRLLDVKEHFIEVLADMVWDCTITCSKWSVLSGMVDLLKPFAVSTTLLSGEMYSTIGSVVPDLLEIQMHLDSFVANEDSPKKADSRSEVHEK